MRDGISGYWGTVASVLRDAAVDLAARGAATPRLDAGLLLGELLGLSRSGLIAAVSHRVDAETAAAFGRLLARRRAGEPVARILGRRGFWTLELEVDEHVLDPRSDSETVVEAALAGLPSGDAARRVLDLGTGSGCLLLSLLAELPAGWGVGVDRSPGAAATARRNARRNGLADRCCFVVGDWGGALAATFDLVVANPPYIPTAELASLPAEVVRHDPHAALDGGVDGLHAYRAIVRQLPLLLRPGGRALLECGRGQDGAVADLLGAAGLVPDGTATDLGGVVRVVAAKRQLPKNRGSQEKSVGMSEVAR